MRRRQALYLSYFCLIFIVLIPIMGVDSDDKLGLKVLWLSIGATLMALSLAFLVLKSFWRREIKIKGRAEEDEKHEHLRENQGRLVVLVVFIAFISYISMLLASLYSTQQNVTIIRYVEWFVTTPLLLIDLALIAHIAHTHLNHMIFLDLVMISLGLAAVFTSNLYAKYTLFALSTIAMILIFIILFRAGSFKNTYENSNVTDTDDDVVQTTLDKSFNANIYTIVLWTLYPVVWILSDQGFSVLSLSNTTFSYMILDVLAKAVFGFVFVI